MLFEKQKGWKSMPVLVFFVSARETRNLYHVSITELCQQNIKLDHTNVRNILKYNLLWKEKKNVLLGLGKHPSLAEYLFWLTKSGMEMVSLSVKHSQFWAPEKRLEMYADLLEKTPAFDAT